MKSEAIHPFDSIESAHEFVALLEASIVEAAREVQQLLEPSEQDERRREALSLALYKMNQLATHIQKSRRILNDLRSIRILLFKERASGGSA
jgi:hypothetical protein